VARTRPEGRLDEILDAAASVFMAKGFRRTRMSDIAREAGVSAGLLYTYAENKDALYHAVFDRALGAMVDQSALPLRTPSAEDAKAVRKRAAGMGAIAALDRALESRRRPNDIRAELEQIVGEHYDQIHRYRNALRLVERSAIDTPELTERFYVRGRQPFVARLTTYVERRMNQGLLRRVPDPAVAARFVIESVAWFANHRYGDHDGGQIDDDVARATVLQIVCDGLVAP
jgi:AcrR family transcriptional regulator